MVNDICLVEGLCVYRLVLSIIRFLFHLFQKAKTISPSADLRLDSLALHSLSFYATNILNDVGDSSTAPLVGKT